MPFVCSIMPVWLQEMVNNDGFAIRQLKSQTCYV